RPSAYLLVSTLPWACSTDRGTKFSDAIISRVSRWRPSSLPSNSAISGSTSASGADITETEGRASGEAVTGASLSRVALRDVLASPADGRAFTPATLRPMPRLSEPSPYVEFDRKQWRALRMSTPLAL